MFLNRAVNDRRKLRSLGSDYRSLRIKVLRLIQLVSRLLSLCLSKLECPFPYLVLSCLHFLLNCENTGRLKCKFLSANLEHFKMVYAAFFCLTFFMHIHSIQLLDVNLWWLKKKKKRIWKLYLSRTQCSANSGFVALPIALAWVIPGERNRHFSVSSPTAFFFFF